MGCAPHIYIYIYVNGGGNSLPKSMPISFFRRISRFSFFDVSGYLAFQQLPACYPVLSLDGLRLGKILSRSDLVLDADHSLDVSGTDLVLQVCISFCQGGSGTEPETGTGTVGTVSPETEAEPEPPEPFSRNRNRNRNRPFLLNCTETQKNPFCRRTLGTENRNRSNRSTLTLQSLLFCQKSEVFEKKARKPRLKARKTSKKQGFHWKTSSPFWKPSLFCQKSKGLSLKKARVKKARVWQKSKGF